jgi:hypothetical protein
MCKFVLVGLCAAILLTFGVANRADAQCLLGFAATSSSSVNNSPEALTAGDFNRDGRVDVAVVNRGSSNVLILLNQPAGFASNGTYSTGASPSSITAGDYNKDGKTDLIVTNQSSNTFTLMRGDGAGGFVSGFTFSTQAQPTSAVLADFNLDGAQDIAVVHLNGPLISIFFGDGTGAFVNSLNLSHAQFKGGTKLTVSDVNLDGKPDIIALGKLLSGNFEYEAIIVALANGAGGFGTFDFIGTTGWSGTVADFVITDVNNDAKPDIISTITTISNGVKYTVSRGNGMGAFPVADTTFDADAFGTGNGSSLAAADFNRDGKVDLAFSNSSPSTTANFYTLPGNGTGTFSAAIPFVAGGSNAQKIITADFNGDGKPDIASTSSSQNKVNITLNSCGGLTTRPKGDFDGDGKTDLAIFRPAAGEWWYLKSATPGGSGALQFGSSSDRPVPADFTGDGRTDIAFWRPSTGTWFVLRSEDFSFYAFPFGTNGDTPTTGDYDGDGKADPAIFRPSTGLWFINLSSGGTSIQQFGQNGDVPVPGN